MSLWIGKFISSCLLVFFSVVAIDRAVYASAATAAVPTLSVTEPEVMTPPGHILEGGVKVFGINFNKGFVEQLETHLDRVSPLFLAGISAYYYSEKNVPKATFYYQAALLRMNIDAKIIPDNMLDDYPAMITMILGDFFFEYELTKKAFLEHLDALLKAKIEVVDWDKKTPRNYSIWEVVKQDHEKVKAMIDQVYKEWDVSTTALTNEVMRYKRMLATMSDDQNVSELFNLYIEKLTKENNSIVGDRAPGDFINQ